MHEIAYFAPNTEVLKVIFLRKNEKKRLNKTGGRANLNSKKTEIGLNDTKCIVLDYEVGSWITKDVNKLQNNNPAIFLIIQLY